MQFAIKFSSIPFIPEQKPLPVLRKIIFVFLSTLICMFLGLSADKATANGLCFTCDACDNCDNGSCQDDICYRDGEGEGEPCPAPRPCGKINNRIGTQDNGYHDTLQALHGVKEKTINVYESSPETATAPAQYSTTPAPQYKGLPNY